MKVRDKYDEVFEVEIEGWCYGVSNFPGEIYPSLIHRVIQELAPTFRIAIEYHHIFNVLDVAEKIARSAKFLVHEEEVMFSILAQLPSPFVLDEEEQFVLAQIIDKAEQKYGNVLERLNRKWHWEQHVLQSEKQDKKAA